MLVYWFIQDICQTGGISHSSEHNIRMLTAASQRLTLKNGAIKFISWSKFTIKKRDFSEGGLNTGTEEKKLSLGRRLCLQV